MEDFLLDPKDAVWYNSISHCKFLESMFLSPELRLSNGMYAYTGSRVWD